MKRCKSPGAKLLAPGDPACAIVAAGAWRYDLLLTPAERVDLRA